MARHNTVTLSDSDRGLRAAEGLLRAGELVAFPTETVYGLGGDARNDRAIDALARRVGASRIAVAPIPRSGLGLAINDRLARAAAPRSRSGDRSARAGSSAPES